MVESILQKIFNMSRAKYITGVPELYNFNKLIATKIAPKHKLIKIEF